MSGTIELPIRVVVIAAILALNGLLDRLLMQGVMGKTTFWPGRQYPPGGAVVLVQMFPFLPFRGETE